MHTQGISDTPAWIVSKANNYARMSGKTPFVVYQGAWSILERDVEQEILSMVRSEGATADHSLVPRGVILTLILYNPGLAFAPWNVLAGGKIRTDEEEERRRKTGEEGRKLMSSNWERTPEEREVCLALEKVAKEIGAKSITAVAIAYVMQKMPYVFPIIGGRKIEHLHANLEALEITLSQAQIEYLESIKPFKRIFPQSHIVSNLYAMET